MPGEANRLNVLGIRWIGAGFAAFGLLVGLVCGLSEAKLTTTLLGLLFALIGGSLGALLGKLDSDGRRITGLALLAFSVCAMLGIVGGITIRRNDLLRIGPAPAASGHTAAGDAETKTGDAETKTDDADAKAPASVYLKTSDVELNKFLTLEIDREHMTLPQACEVLQKQRKTGARSAAIDGSDEASPPPRR